MMIFHKLRWFIKRSTPSIQILGWQHFFLGCLARVFQYLNCAHIGDRLDRIHKEQVIHYLSIKYKSVIERIKNERFESVTVDMPSYVWVMWWQGEQQAPEIIKKCIASIRHYAGEGREVVVIDQQNYAQWISLPNYVIEKYQRGTLPVQYVSDLARLMLINQYGGVWIDATFLLVKQIPQEYFEKPFYTCHTINGAKWTGFFIGGCASNAVIKPVCELLLEYWEKEDVLIDYFLTDCLIDLVYRNIEEAKSLIDSVPDNNLDVLFFINHAAEPCNEYKYKKLLATNYAFKLTWKKVIGSCKNSYGSRLLSDFT